MTTKNSALLSFIIVMVAFVTGTYFYPHLPALVASHWNAMGQVNGYLPRFWGAFTVPFIMAFAALLLYGLPALDPLREHGRHFEKYYNRFVVFMMVFLLYIYILVMYLNLGFMLNIGQCIVPAFAVLWFLVGDLLPHVKRNWFIGIRTPWTYSSEFVWNRTHALGGIVFQVAAVAILVGAFFPRISIWFIIVPVAVSVIIPVVYSYVAYKRSGSRTEAPAVPDRVPVKAPRATRSAKK